MSDIHYDAFISYRHVPRDIQVAADVQRQLERFRVPAAIRRQTGRRRIGRVFRDREELPVTSDLQESIAAALANSDYLIVICSPDTKESIWVQREIDCFLQTHTADQVLTVLSAGEDPGEIIPEVLLYEEKDGVRKMREPLSCDYRRELKKARREELPRLAAVLLGCTYDDLRQRQRQYRTRRLLTLMTAAMAVLAAAAGYLAWSGQQIRESLRQSQINESRFLANAAREEFQSGNRILAARLALEALPSAEDPDRPVSPEAEAALSEALYACQIPSNMNVGAIRVFDTNAKISRLRTDEENRRLAALDETGTAHVWNMDTGQKLAVIPSGGKDWMDLAIAAEGRLLLFATDEVRCCDASSGQKLWSKAVSLPVSGISDNPTLCAYALSADGSTLFLQKEADWTAWEEYLLEIRTTDGTVASERDLTRVKKAGSRQNRPEDGTSAEPDTDGADPEKEEPAEEEPAEEEQAYWSVRAVAADGDSGRAAVLEASGVDVFRVLLSETAGKAMTEIRLPYAKVYAMGFDQDGRLLVCGYPAEADQERAVPDTYFMYETLTITGQYSADVSCFGQDGTPIWSRTFSATMENSYPAVLSGTFRDDQSTEKLRCDVCLLGNTVLFLDPETGEEMGNYLLPSTIMGGEVCEPSVRVVLHSGDMGYLYPCGDKAYLNRSVSANAEAAVFAGGYLANDDNAVVGVLSSGRREILLYTGGIGDGNWKLLESELDSERGLLSRWGMDGQTCAVLTERGEDGKASVDVLDLTERRVVRTIGLPGETTDFKWMGFSEETGILTLLYQESLWVNEAPARCLQVNTADGTVTDREIPLPAEGDGNVQIRDAAGDGEALYLLVSSVQADTGWRYAPGTEELTKLFSEEKEDYTSASILWMDPSPEGRHLLLIYDTGEVTLADTQTGDIHFLERDIFHSNVPYSRDDLHCVWKDEDTFLLTWTNAEELVLADCTGAVTLAVSCAGKSPESVCLHGGEIWVLYGDASLECYAASDGTLRRRIELEKGGTIFSLYDYSWTWRDGQELQICGGGSLYCIDTEAGVCTQKVNLCMGSPASGDLYLLNLGSYETDVPYGYYERYTLEDLLRLGHEMTDGQPVSQEDQEKYGLKEE